MLFQKSQRGTSTNTLIFLHVIYYTSQLILSDQLRTALSQVQLILFVNINFKNNVRKQEQQQWFLRAKLV